MLQLVYGTAKILLVNIQVSVVGFWISGDGFLGVR